MSENSFLFFPPLPTILLTGALSDGKLPLNEHDYDCILCSMRIPSVTSFAHLLCCELLCGQVAFDWIIITFPPVCIPKLFDADYYNCYPIYANKMQDPI